jgi:hypothetical protein
MTVQFQSGEGQQPGQAEPKPAENTTPGALTPEQIEALVEKATNKAFRAIQSSQSKQEKRIKEYVQQQVTLLRGSGVEVTPEIERAIHHNIREQLAEPDGEDEPVQPTAQVAAPKATKTQPDPVDDFIAEVREMYGVEVEDTDAEAGEIVNNKSWAEYKRTYIEAARAKAAREAANPPKARPIPNAVSAAGASSQESLREQYIAEVKAHRGAGPQWLQKTKEAFRNRGFDPDSNGGTLIR